MKILRRLSFANFFFSLVHTFICIKNNTNSYTNIYSTYICVNNSCYNHGEKANCYRLCSLKLEKYSVRKIFFSSSYVYL